MYVFFSFFWSPGLITLKGILFADDGIGNRLPPLQGNAGDEEPVRSYRSRYSLRNLTDLFKNRSYCLYEQEEANPLQSLEVLSEKLLITDGHLMHKRIS
ncbi:hypothetical protein Mapa_016241 [Marchantia paleacea]|nr:hypothetical protein Mapa_016241 [Marchantia paleacea]